MKEADGSGAAPACCFEAGCEREASRQADGVRVVSEGGGRLLHFPPSPLQCRTTIAWHCSTRHYSAGSGFCPAGRLGREREKGKIGGTQESSWKERSAGVFCVCQLHRHPCHAGSVTDEREAQGRRGALFAQEQCSRVLRTSCQHSHWWHPFRDTIVFCILGKLWFEPI